MNRHPLIRLAAQSALRATIFSACCLLGLSWQPNAIGASVPYVMQTGNINSNKTLISSGGFAGDFNSGSTVLGLFANSGAGQDNDTAFETLNTTGQTTGAARALQVGDTFTLTLNILTNNPFGFAGVYFDQNTTYTAYSNYNTNEGTAISIGNSGNWKIENNGASVDTGIGNNTSFTFTLAVTSTNTFNVTIGATTYYDMVFKNSISGGLTSMAIALQNDHGDFLVSNGSLSNAGTVTIGGSNISEAFTGISDGLGANSTSTVSSNSLTKNGATSTDTLAGANTYTGATNVTAGILNVQNGSSLGATTTAGVSISSGATLQLQGGIALSTGTGVTMGGTGAAGGTGALENVLGNNSIAGNILLSSTSQASSDNGTLTLSGTVNMNGFRLIAGGSSNASTAVLISGPLTGSGNILKQGTGSLTLSGNNSGFTANSAGSVNVFEDTGSVIVSNANALGSTNGSTTGYVGLGTSNVALSGDNTALYISTPGVTVSNPIDSRWFSTAITGTKTIGGTNTTGSVTFAGSIALHDSLVVTATAGGTVVLSGTIAQGVGGQASGTATDQLSGTSGGTVPGLTIGNSGNAGTVSLTGTGTYAGGTTINGGTFVVSGGILGSTTVNSAGTLGGSGSVSPSGTVTVNGALQPSVGGGAPTTLTTGSLAFTNNSTYSVQLASTSSGDQTVASGVSLSGTVQLSIGLGFSSSTVQSFDILKNIGTEAIAGNFYYGTTKLTEGTVFGVSSNGFSDVFTVSYVGGTSGQDLVLTIPEPGTVAIAILGGSFLLGMRRGSKFRRRRM